LSYWPSKKARQVFKAIERVGWTIKEEKGSSHKQMVHPSYPEATWAFKDSEEIGPKMMARLAKVFHFDRGDL
jgi:predicted RNA binding protein YcfA (HicA-like mRNA interferase family)